MVDVAPLKSRRGATHPAELAVDRHQIDQSGADAQLVEADRFLFFLPSCAEHVDVKARHSFKAGDSEDHMIDGLDVDHARFSAATPGSVRPSIHSRNAPPAVETKVKS